VPAAQLLIDRAAAGRAPVLELAPQEITVHASTQDREVVRRFRGLPFARWNDARGYFDACGTWKNCEEVELKQLVLNLQNFRNPRAPETRHKTTEDLDRPLQAEDWSRIRCHQEAGIPGVQLQLVPPLVYLIAPALRFHPSTDVLLEFLRPEMEVLRIGLAESWRRGLRGMLRQ
jgi:hypothetical protein